MSRCCGKARFELGEPFFQEIIRHPVPLDMNTIKALKRCALGLDLYLWLTYRTFALRAPLRLTWHTSTTSSMRTRLKGGIPTTPFKTSAARFCAS